MEQKIIVIIFRPIILVFEKNITKKEIMLFSLISLVTTLLGGHLSDLYTSLIDVPPPVETDDQPSDVIGGMLMNDQIVVMVFDSNGNLKDIQIKGHKI